MYVLQLKALNGTNATATLITAANPYVNGRMPVANDYRGNILVVPGTDYKLSVDAIRSTPVVGEKYSVAGSWISNVLHVTSMRKVIETTTVTITEVAL